MLTSLSSENIPRTRRYFGDYVLDPGRGTLMRKGREIPLRPKSIAVLSYLVANPGKLVSKEELLDAVWGHAYVSEGSLGQCLMDVRRALGDEERKIIRTVPRRGYIFELSVSVDEGQSGSEAGDDRPHGRARARRIQLGLGGAAALAGLFLVWLLVADGWFRGTGTTGSQSHSIVVLPFADLSSGGDHEYFADGLTEELINALTQLEGLRVIARTSSFAFKGSDADVPTIVEQLGVSHVLEGSVRKSGNDIRITAQLVDGGTNTHVWSRTYDRTLDDIFAVQGEIAGSVAESLQASLPVTSAETVTASRSPEAYEHYLQGRYFWRRQGEGDFERAEEHYRRAVAIDPELADAWAALAGVMGARVQEGTIGLEQGAAEQRRMLERALSINPNMSEALARLAGSYFVQGEREIADRYWARALELGENNAVVQAMAASWAGWRGLYAEAVDRSRKAVRLDPLAANFRTNLAIYLLAAGQLDEAAQELRQAMALSPGPHRSAYPTGRERLHDLALIEILQGRPAEALELIESRKGGLNQDQIRALAYVSLGRDAEAGEAIERIRAVGTLEAELRLAEIEAFQGNQDSAFERLHAINGALDTNFRGSRAVATEIRKSPLFISMRNDPRWEALWVKWKHRL